MGRLKTGSCSDHVTIVVTTVLVMGVSGRTAQFVLKKEEKKDE